MHACGKNKRKIKEERNEIYDFSIYLVAKDMRKVHTGAMLRKAQANVAEVCSSPRKKRY